MLIDWFTFSAQVVNFLILIWLMKHFLYKPVLNAIDAREKLIAKELADAAKKQTEAKKERDLYEQKNEKFDLHYNKLLGKVKAEADAERKRLLNQVQNDTEVLRSKQDNALKSDLVNLQKEISRQTQDEVFAITRKVMTDLAGTTLEEQISKVFTNIVRNLDSEKKQDLAKALKASSEPAVVRSAFVLPQKQQDTIKKALEEIFSEKLNIRFETSPKVISGIELSTNGQKIAWSIADYLVNLENRINKLLGEQTKIIAKHKTKPTLKSKAKVKKKVK
ncbi:MAG: F0F1 ATP synthase subunit delta [Candidatus Margulisbacteria bacterium]|nr:F0F1 ATP synthase subunit delta [Candidatus Margulisiibacteriota bacterium]